MISSDNAAFVGCPYCGFANGDHSPDCPIVRGKEQKESELGAALRKAFNDPKIESVRSFDTGATRSSDAGRIDPEGFLSPIVIERFCEYMNKHRVQPDGSTRASDNWQKGIPLPTYMKGMWRHFLHLWTRHRGHTVTDPKATADIEEDLCSIMFNAQGMLYEILKAKG